VIDADPRSASADAQTPRLSQELSEFLVELSVAMHKHAIYPHGHPLLTQSVEAVHDSLIRLLVERPALSIGVARRQLIIEGVATGALHPLLSELAGKLHRHHIGALKFLRGISRDELASALERVGIEAQRDEKPLGMQPEILDSLWVNVKLFPLTYDRLELLDEEEAADEDGSARPPGGRDTRAAQLWVGLARAAIASEQGRSQSDGELEPEHVAKAIDDHDREPAYDQVIVGYLLQIAHEVRHDDTQVQASAGLKRRISKLVGSLQPATLRRLLDMGGDTLQRRKFVLDAAQGMNVDAVVELVQAAANAEGQTISHSLVRMLTKLATHAAQDTGRRGNMADEEFREHVERLVSSWSLDDPNPLAYSAALEHMSRADPATAPDEAQFPCEPARVILMALELGVTGDAVTRALTASLARGQLAELLDVLDTAPPGREEISSQLWTVIAAADPLGALLVAPKLDHQLIRRVAMRLGAAGAPALVRAVIVLPSGAHHDRLIATLISLGADAAPAVAAQLASAAPPIVCELLAGLKSMAPAKLPGEARSFLAHGDAAVRREAARLLLSYEETRDAAMLVAVRDDDACVVAAGLQAAQERCPPLVASTIRLRVDRGEITESAALVAAVRAVAGVSDEQSVEWLVRRTMTTGGLLRRPRLTPTSPEMLAALNVLAARWGSDSRATPALELARSSTSATVRAAVRGERLTMRTEAIK